jgi:hypothetical protein
MTAHPLRNALGLAGGGSWLAPAVEMAAMASGNWPSPQPGPAGWTCFPRVAIRTPGPDARAVREARGFAIATLQRWGVADRWDDVALVVSELLTNALRHALPGPGEPCVRCPVRLGLLQAGPCVLCAVADPSQHPPVLKEPASLAETGRGLRVIGRIADAWGCTTPCDTGKVVWAVLSVKPAPAGMGPRPADGQVSAAHGQALRVKISRSAIAGSGLPGHAAPDRHIVLGHGARGAPALRLDDPGLGHLRAGEEPGDHGPPAQGVPS